VRHRPRSRSCTDRRTSGGDRRTALVGQLAQVGSAQLGLGGPHLGTQVEKLGEFVRPAQGQQVDQPCGDRRAAQLAQRGGPQLVTGRAASATASSAGRDEVGGRQTVQPIGHLILSVRRNSSAQSAGTGADRGPS